MKIVITTATLFDSKSPFNHLFKDMLQGFISAGHQVVRIVACQNLEDTDYKLGIENPAITYIPMVRKSKDKANIIKRYLADTLTHWRMGKQLKRIKDADVLFEDVSYSSYCSVHVAFRRKMRVVSMMQDVWPDNAVASGIISKGSLLYRYFEFWQKKVYAKSNQIICISDDIKALMVSKGVPENRLQVIYNWGYGDQTVDISWDQNCFAQEQGLEKGEFYAVYAGNIGRLQNVELVIQAAQLLQNEDGIRFLIIGDGVKRSQIEEMITKANLKNVVMLPMQKAELASHIYCAAGVNIIPLMPDGIQTALPSKTGVCLSCGRPILFCFGEDCKFAQVVKEYGAGQCISASDPTQLANHIQALSMQKSEKIQGAYALFEAKFTRSGNMKKYIDAIEAK